MVHRPPIKTFDDAQLLCFITTSRVGKINATIVNYGEKKHKKNYQIQKYITFEAKLIRKHPGKKTIHRSLWFHQNSLYV